MSQTPNPFAEQPPPGQPLNPYAPPSGFHPPAGTLQFAPCPSCSNTWSKKVGFTWWGGVVGPAILSHVKCAQCGTEYNGKTGRSNTTGIVIYTVVGGLIAVVIFGLLILGSLTS